jgi:hypothetical protein
MSVRLTSTEGKVALFDSVTEWAFGPVFDSVAQADDFLAFTAEGQDLRTLSDRQLEQLLAAWHKAGEGA